MYHNVIYLSVVCEWPEIDEISVLSKCTCTFPCVILHQKTSEVTFTNVMLQFWFNFHYVLLEIKSIGSMFA